MMLKYLDPEQAVDILGKQHMSKHEQLRLGVWVAPDRSSHFIAEQEEAEKRRKRKAWRKARKEREKEKAKEVKRAMKKEAKAQAETKLANFKGCPEKIICSPVRRSPSASLPRNTTEKQQTTRRQGGESAMDFLRGMDGGRNVASHFAGR